MWLDFMILVCFLGFACLHVDRSQVTQPFVIFSDLEVLHVCV